MKGKKVRFASKYVNQPRDTNEGIALLCFACAVDVGLCETNFKAVSIIVKWGGKFVELGQFARTIL